MSGACRPGRLNLTGDLHRRGAAHAEGGTKESILDLKCEIPNLDLKCEIPNLDLKREILNLDLKCELSNLDLKCEISNLSSPWLLCFCGGGWFTLRPFHTPASVSTKI
jgi:hypothetical protein